MAFTEVSPPNKYSVGFIYKTVDQEYWVNSASTHHSYYADVGWILKTSHSRGISRGIATPMAEKTK